MTSTSPLLQVLQLLPPPLGQRQPYMAHRPASPPPRGPLGPSLGLCAVPLTRPARALPCLSLLHQGSAGSTSPPPPSLLKSLSLVHLAGPALVGAADQPVLQPALASLSSCLVFPTAPDHRQRLCSTYLRGYYPPPPTRIEAPQGQGSLSCPQPNSKHLTQCLGKGQMLGKFFLIFFIYL